MTENKITQDFLSTAYDVLGGKTSVVPTFQEQADEVLFEMWLNDEIQLEDTQYEELIDLYKQFKNNEITEKQLEEGILSTIAKKAGSLAAKGAKKAGSLAAKGAKKAGSLAAKGVKAGAKKVAKRLSTQGRIDAAKKKLGSIKKKKELKQVKKDIKKEKSS
jgi:hypothetical protein